MKHVLTAIVGVALIAGVAAASSSPAHARGLVSAPCTPKNIRIHGNVGTAWCGPAVATLSISGKTFTFHRGDCGRTYTGGVVIDLGTTVDQVAGSPVTNAGRPLIIISIEKAGARITEAFFGGKLLVLGSSIKLSGNPPLRARFRGLAGKKSFTGTWDCHGHVYD